MKPREKKKIILTSSLVTIFLFSALFFPLYFHTKTVKATMQKVDVSINEVECTDMFGRDYILKIGAGWRKSFNKYPEKIIGVQKGNYASDLIITNCYAEIIGTNQYRIEIFLSLNGWIPGTESFTITTSGLGVTHWSETLWFGRFGGRLRISYSINLV